jgi:hypothetical protein
MKTTITILSLVLLITIVTSCNKETTTVTITHNDTTTDTLITTDTSVLGLLTQKQWELDTLYYNYTGPGTGTLEYARGGSSNLINEDNLRDIYWPDGSTDYFDNSGTYSTGTWTIVDVDSTVLHITTPGGPIHAKILKLDKTHYTSFDSTNHALNIQIYKP